MIKAIEPLGKHDRAGFSCGVASHDMPFRLLALDVSHVMRKCEVKGSASFCLPTRFEGSLVRLTFACGFRNGP